jgi:hypothetical protein
MTVLLVGITFLLAILALLGAVAWHSLNMTFL